MSSVVIKKPVLKFLKTLRLKTELKRIFRKLEQLSSDPFPADAKRVDGIAHGRVFRIRVGSYRILYSIESAPSAVFIEKIDKRSRVHHR